MFAFTVSAVVFTYCSIYGGYCRQREIRYQYVAKWQKRAFIDKTSNRKVIDDRPTRKSHNKTLPFASEDPLVVSSLTIISLTV